MGDLEEIIRRLIDQALSRLPRPGMGEVTSYDPNRYAVKVKMQPEGVETGWVPIGSTHVGDGFGLAIGLEIGDQVGIDYLNGDVDSPFVTGRIASDKQRPPVAQSGEFVLQTKAGATIKIDKSGKLTTTTNGTDIVINAGGGNVTIN